MKTGMMSRRKERGGWAPAWETFTGTSSDCPSKATLRVVSPSATGQKMFPSRLRRAGLAGVMVASDDTSRVTPSA